MFGVGHGPVDAVVVSDAGEPGESLAAVVSPAERIQISSRGFAFWHWYVVIKIAAVGRYGAGRVAAAAGANLDRVSQSP